jgi:hypothetical protein
MRIQYTRGNERVTLESAKRWEELADAAAGLLGLKIREPDPAFDEIMKLRSKTEVKQKGKRK